MRRQQIVFILAAAIALIGRTAAAQTADIPDVQPETTHGIWKALTDDKVISMSSFILANVADVATDWTWTVRGKTYHVSAVQRTAFVGGLIGGAIALTYYVPKSKKWVVAGMVVGCSILAGKAYGQSFSHGTPATASPLAKNSTPLMAARAAPQFGVRLR